jgi:hypothetical protein
MIFDNFASQLRQRRQMIFVVYENVYEQAITYFIHTQKFG